MNPVRIVVCLLTLVVAACSELAPRPAYVGEFTGEYVDGKPLYRFPAIQVVGRR
jgi:hypothetical protein